MTYDFVELDGILCEFKIYDYKIDFESLFNQLSDEVRNDLSYLTDLHYEFFKKELNVENTTSISISLNSVKKIDKIPIKAHISIWKNYKYISIVNGDQRETTKICVNICLPSYEYVLGTFEMLQSSYLINFNLEDEIEFKK